MAYNGAQSSPPGYGPPGGFTQWPPGAGPPGMAGPPGSIPAPGTALPPGMAPPPQSLPSRLGNLPPGFGPPANMPKFDFSASVIRMGSNVGKDSPFQGRGRDGNADQQGGNRRGLGMNGTGDQGGQRMKENFIPPTREEIARTIFVGNISEGVRGDVGVERVLRTAGGLRRWIRAHDADNKPCKFGFAEFEDAESLETAALLFRNIEVPLKRVAPTQPKANEDAEAGAEADAMDHQSEVEKTTLLFVVDEASVKYAEEWRERRGESEEQLQDRVDAARQKLDAVLTSLFTPTEVGFDADGDISMHEGVQLDISQPTNVQNVEITGTGTGEDELSDIPAEMREVVAAEITAFRERSIRRDMERLKREEELEARERASSRPNRAASPSLNGFVVGTNNIPLGPRDRGVHGAPSGPKAKQDRGFHGAQIPSDYQNGVKFVNGNAASLSSHITKEEEESDASDEELERRRREKKEAEQEKLYLDYERKWLNRERSRAAAIEREKGRDEQETGVLTQQKEEWMKRLKEWNDDAEAQKQTEEYYRDRRLWLSNRAVFRAMEKEADDKDRAEENLEQASKDQARGMADNFLDRQAEELTARGLQAPQEPQRFKISLGAAVQKAQEAAAPKRRGVADVELLLDNDDEAEQVVKRTLIPIKFDTAAEAALLTEDERNIARQQLAQDIPDDKGSLFSWEIQWDVITEDAILVDKLKPFVQKKIVEYLGVQEEEIVDVVEQSLRTRGKPQDLVGELEGALDDEAEVLVRKLWRMLVFYSEADKKGILN